MPGLGGGTEGNRRRGKPGRRWEYNTTSGLQEMGGRGVRWIYLAQDREVPVSTVMNLRVP